MEKVENTETSQVYENDMELYLSQFCKDQKIEDIRQESQSVWNAALMYIKRHAFNEPDCLKSKSLVNTTGSFTGGVSNYNACTIQQFRRVCGSTEILHSPCRHKMGVCGDRIGIVNV